MSPLGRWSFVVVLASLLATGTEAAGERTHIVAPGESASSLAKRYYGDPDLARLLLRYNRKPGTVIHPGDRLTIPFCDVARVRPGDTWSALAKRRFDRASAGAALAELNGFAAGESLRVGARVVFPVVLQHTLARGETLASLAERFYGDAHKATILQAFRPIGDAKRLGVGTVLEIPLVAFVPAPTDPSPEAASEPAVVSAPPPPKEPAKNVTATVPPAVVESRFAAPLAEAEGSFTAGEYDRARELLEALRERVTADGSPAERLDWGRLLAFVYIALDRDGEACAVFRSALPPGEPPRFDPDRISPRIREALSSCAAGDPKTGRLDSPGVAPQISLHADTQR